MKIKIIVVSDGEVYKAYAKDRPSLSEWGETANEAIGNLIQEHQEFFHIELAFENN